MGVNGEETEKGRNDGAEEARHAIIQLVTYNLFRHFTGGLLLVVGCPAGEVRSKPL